MAGESSGARRRAGALSADPGAVDGPLHGYHHETYVLPLPDRTGPDSGARWKCREPRTGLFWFDRRCFESEEHLLQALQGRVTRVPDLIEAGGVVLQRFIEGRTLGSSYKSGRAVPESVVDQIADLFGQLAAITPDTLTVGRRCGVEDRAADGDTDAFVERLMDFAEDGVYRANYPQFGSLFDALGVGELSFKNLREHVADLTRRPFCLLHADLHRENLIVDPEGQLWTIDWELAMLGDPLYDLATHLYLMKYPARQQEELVRRWCATVEDVLPGSSAGWRHDLPRLLDFKRAQSVFTDVIRVAQSLVVEEQRTERGLGCSALKLYDVLRAAAEPLGLTWLPVRADIEAALAAWREQQEAQY